MNPIAAAIVLVIIIAVVIRGWRWVNKDKDDND